MKSLVIVSLLILMSSPFVISSQCGSASEQERMLLEAARPVNVESASLQEEAGKDPSCRAMLVKPDQYTTGGAAYHREYERCLLAIAYVLSTKMKLSVLEHSVGLYYDKKDGRKDRLFLGFDLDAPRAAFSGRDPFEKNAPRILESQLGGIIAVAHSCTSLFKEKSVVGMAIGFRWEGPAGRESLIIWIDERDMEKFEKRELLLKELIGKSGITDSRGKLVRLIP